MGMRGYFYEKSGTERSFYTDLAAERRRADVECEGVEYEKKITLIGTWERVRITSEEGEISVMRPIGTYDTLTTERLDELSEAELNDAAEEIAKKLCLICDEIGVFPARILVAGFGNETLTPDSVGPKSAKRVKPTLHISENDAEFFDEMDCSEIAVFCPGVAANSGMDSSENLRMLSERLTPDLIIAIDSIMTSSKERLGATFQISSTGLFPGGLGNLHSPVTRSSMGSPVIAIGVPTVIDCRHIAKEGFVGDSLFVSPREIDLITDNAAFVIGGAINQAFGIDL